MKQGIKEPQGLHVEALEALDTRTEEAVRSLGFNALDHGEINPTREELGDDMRALRESYLKEGSHGALFVVKDDERVVGFLALKKMPGGEGQIMQLRYAAGTRGETIVRELIEAAIKYLRAVPCTKLVIEGAAPRHELSVFCEAENFAPPQATEEGKVRLEKSLGA